MSANWQAYVRGVSELTLLCLNVTNNKLLIVDSNEIVNFL